MWNRTPKYGLSSQEIESESSLENNWGNWPIDSTLTSSAPISNIYVLGSSEEKFENWPLELSTTEEALSVNGPLTNATKATNISIESSENQSISIKIPEEMKFWHHAVLFPSFSNKTTPEINTNISTTTITTTDTEVKVSNTRVNSTSRWFVSMISCTEKNLEGRDFWKRQKRLIGFLK